MITRTLGPKKAGTLESVTNCEDDASNHPGEVMFTVMVTGDRVDHAFFYLPKDEAREFLGAIEIGSCLVLHSVTEVEVVQETLDGFDNTEPA